MNKKEYLRGHEIEFIDDEFVYCDTKESTADTWKERPCGFCGLHNTQEGHDACLGTLKGVMNACCGHGSDRVAYVQFLDGSCVYKDDAITIQNILKNGKSIV